MTTYGFFNWPVWEALLVTEMTEIEYITKKFIFQLRILDDWHSTVLERQRGGGGEGERGRERGGGREGEGERGRERGGGREGEGERKRERERGREKEGEIKDYG